MMKKRILASSMASVMALSSVSVVAFADEAKKDYGEAVTKAELEAYVEGLQSFIDDELDAYGEVQGEDFTKALNHANNVIEDSRAVATDYVAAYQMLKAVKDSLRIYTADELKALVKANASTYNSENVLNKELGDKIYTDETFTEFAEAYIDAEGNIESEDDRAITDAYLTLFKAEEKLEKLGTVTKSEFRKALQAYEALEAKMADYEPWRRGTATVKPSTKSDDAGDITKAKGYMTFGTLIDLVYGGFGAAKDENDAEIEQKISYWDGQKWSSVSNKKEIKDENGNSYSPKQYSYNKLIGKDVAFVNDSTKSKELYTAINALYDGLDAIKGATETSDKQYINAYKTAVDAVNVFNGWQPDTKKSSTKTSTVSLEKTYHSQLVEIYNQADVDAIETRIEGFTYEVKVNGSPVDKNFKVSYDWDKHTMKSDKTIYIVVNKNTGRISGVLDATKVIFDVKADAETAQSNADTLAAVGAATAEETQVMTVSMSTNIYSFIEAGSAQVTVAKTADALLTEIDTEANALSTPPTNCSLTGDTIKVGKSDVEIQKVKVDAGLDAATAATAAEAAKTHNEKVDELVARTAALKKMSANSNVVLNGALVDFETYKGLNFTSADTKEASKSTAEGIIDRLSNSGPQLSTINGSAKEWTLVWRNLAYALEDTFPVAQKTDKTLDKLMKLIDDSYESTELTGDSAAFETQHLKVVDTRQKAYEFWKVANAEGKNYDEGDTLLGTNLETVYKNLNDAVSNLKKALAEFEVSYDEIRDAIGKYATAVDKGEVKGDALVKAINQCAYDLSVLEASVLWDGDSDTENYAFDEDGAFQPANRLKTKKNDKATDVDPNKLEKNLKASYDAMVKAYTDATTGSTVANDFNGDGAFTTTDLKDILDAFTASSTDTKYDVNKDGAFTTSDLKFALDAFTAQA